jgi:multicomponent Na+:H+ antiporter subunit D
MISGLGLNSFEGISGSVHYMIHDIILKTNLFFIAGLLFKMQGTYILESMGGVLDKYPRYAFVIAIVFFSLIGVPPLSGFWPKISLFKGALIVQNWYLIFGFLFATFITLVIVVRIWNRAIARKLDIESSDNFATCANAEKRNYWLPIGFLLIFTIFIGFGADFIGSLSQKIASELLDPIGYLQTVGLKIK